MNARIPAKIARVATLSTTQTAIAVCVLGFALRLFRLDFQPLWGDEGWSFYFASMPVPHMLAKTAVDIHPPFYYALLGAWLKLAGSSPQAARMLSVFFGTLVIALVFAFARFCFGRVAGLCSAFLVAVAPFAVFYSQEVRMYGLVALLGVGSCLLLVVGLGSPSPHRLAWPAYAVVTTLALYTLYYAGFLVVAQGLFLAVVWILGRAFPGRAETGRRLRVGLLGLAGAILLYIPWLVFASGKLVTYVQGKRAAEAYLPVGLGEYLRAHFAAFSMGHLPDAFRPLVWGAVAFVVVAGLAVGTLVQEATAGRRWAEIPPSGTPSRRWTWLVLAALFVPLLLGFSVNLLFPFTPPSFERTLLVAAPAWWVLVGAGLAWCSRFRKPVFWAALGVLAVLSAAGLYPFFTVPRYRDDDYRQLLSVVRAHSTDDDVILASYQWQEGLFHAYLPAPHPRFYEVPEWGAEWAVDSARMESDLLSLTRAHPRLWFPAYQSLGRLWETDVERFLDRNAFPAEVDWTVLSTKLSLYGGQGAPMATSDAALPARFGPNLMLARASVGTSPVQAGRDILPISLEWEVVAPVAEEYHVALRLTDVAGSTWANRDSLPQANSASFSQLPAGQAMADHHGLLVPAGTPPGTYLVRLSVVPENQDRPLDLLDSSGQPLGTEVLLATTQVRVPDPPVLPAALPAHEPKVARFSDGIQLLGFGLSGETLTAGDMLEFSLFWQSLAAPDGEYVGFAQLQDDAGKPVALSEVPPPLPTNRWTPGLLLRDPRQIPLPATLPAGRYRLAIGLMTAEGTRLSAGRADQVVLATVTTTQRPHIFVAPSPTFRQGAYFEGVASLVGYDLPASGNGRRVKAGESVELTLYWQATGETVRDLSVFAHLVDERGGIFGQNDHTPGNGECPTRSWVAGEYLEDHYAIPVRFDTPPGAYFVEVGFYDPVDGSRVEVTGAGDGNASDHFILSAAPISIQ